jgi:L-ascorbate metabolism protein UlaG (beta-lactamase superfamily)
MKTKFITPIIFVLLVNSMFTYSQENGKTCTITYIANDGFLLETKNSKVLIDALFGGIKGNWCDQPGDSVSNLILQGMSPFENIDIVLVTHKHTDHFNEQLVINFLKDNQNTFLICPEQVNDVLKNNTSYSTVSKRIHPINPDNEFDTPIAIKKTNIRALRFKHGSFFETDSVTGEKYDLHRVVENLGYIIDADGFSFFHSGDCSFSDKSHFETYHFSERDFDVVFLDRTFLRKEGQEIMNSFINTRDLVFMHIEPGKAEYYKSIIKDLPGLFVFTQKMEEKLISK